MPDTQSRVRNLLQGDPKAAGTGQWLNGLGFDDTPHAIRRLKVIGDLVSPQGDPVAFLSSLLTGLESAAQPDSVLIKIERFLLSLSQDPTLLNQVASDQRQAEMLVTLFAGSEHMAEILLARPQHYRSLIQALNEKRPFQRIETRRTSPEFHKMAQENVVKGDDFGENLTRLCTLHRREMLRIGACDLLGLWDLAAVTEQLSNLADALIREALELASEVTGVMAGGFVVLALGKLGGRELNYSSDIDLLFLSASQPAAYNRLGIKLMDALRTSTAEGFLYRVDMRLRPWGRMGPLVSSTSGYLNYLQTDARLWEKQALLKARVIAGNTVVGDQFLRDVQMHIFRTDAAQVKSDVREMKEKIEDDLEKKGRGWGEVKLGKGSIRDVEFVTQYLQIINGATHEDIRSPQTLDALDRLYQHGLLPVDDFRLLSDSYTFLRSVEHHLQLMHYRQTHSLPQDQQELFHLATRLRFWGPDAARYFVARYDQHAAAIREVYRKYLGETDPENSIEEVESAVLPHLERLSEDYQLTFEDADILRHAQLAESLTSEKLVEIVPEIQDNGYWRLTIVGYDQLGAFSIICGLLFAHGFDIHAGQIFTYKSESGGEGTDTADLPKIVDVLTVRPVSENVTHETWNSYGFDLAALLAMLHEGKLTEAQGALAQRVAAKVVRAEQADITLSPVEIEIDNETSDEYTVLSIDAVDTTGFLYELTNALALNRINIFRMRVESVGDRVRDSLHVSDHHGRKITSPEDQQRLRAATVLVKHFTHLLPSSPDPESALVHFRALLVKLFREPEWTTEIASLERPEVLDALTQLLGVSDFLWEDFLRLQYTNLFPVMQDIEGLGRQKTRKEFSEELKQALDSADSPEECRRTLNEFKDREMFRVDMRYILRRSQEFGRFSLELTDLAETVVEEAVRICGEELRQIHGEPLLDNGGQCKLSICALGKCGGRELGFASDIELMFIYSGMGNTSGSNSISATAYYNLLVRRVNEAIDSKREGIFEIDLRLRPYGSAGNLAVSENAFGVYFAPGGSAWPYERQMLIKLRPIAGDPGLGRRIQNIRDDIINRMGLFDVDAMRAMRERQIRHLVTPGTVNVKYGPGGLVDLEYFVQGLQISYHRRHAVLRGLTNTREALAALRDVGILSWDDHGKLEGALVFLRQVIDALRMVRGHARDLTIPETDSADFSFLAMRLGYGSNPEQLEQDLTTWMQTVQETEKRLL